MQKYSKLIGCIVGAIFAGAAAFGFGDGATLLGMDEAQFASIVATVGAAIGTFLAPKNAA